MTTLIVLAEARFRASIMIRTSIRWSLTGAQVDWMTKQSHPRTLSSRRIWISPSENRWTSALHNGTPMHSLISRASFRLELQVISFSLLSPYIFLVIPYAPSLCAPSFGFFVFRLDARPEHLRVSRFVDLPAAGDGQIVVAHVAGHGRSRHDVGVLADGHRRDQVAVAADEGAVADDGPVFVSPVVVASEDPAPDVHAGLDFRVTDVAPVGQLAARSER